MMNSVRLFLRNLIKYFLYIAVFAQIVSGTVYLVCNFSEYIVYPETEEMIHVARGLLFDEYTGVLYPLFIRLCLSVQSLFGIGYYWVVYPVQLLLVSASLFYLVRLFFEGKKAWIATAYIISFPMVLQTILMVSPLAFKAVFTFVMIGAMVRLMKGMGCIPNWIYLFLAYILAAFNVTDDLYMWIVPIGIFCVVYFFKNRKKIRIWKRLCILFAVVVIFAVTCGTLNHMAEPGARGRMQRSVSSVLFQRALWPELRIKYGHLPIDIWAHVDPYKALESDASAEQITYIIGPRVDREVGFDRANKLYMESVLNQLSYNKTAICSAILNDCAGYLLTPYSAMSYLTGQEGSAFATLYGMMSAKKPLMTYNYFCIGFVSIFILSFAGILRIVREKLFANKKSIKQFLFFAAILCYQALWYGIANVQGVDYRYGLLNIAVYAIFALSGEVLPEWTKKQVAKKGKLFFNRKKWMMAGGGAIILLGIVLLILVLKKDYRESDVLEEKEIICLGDSIWGLIQDDTGIAAWVEDMTGATIVNYAVPGTTATDTKGTSWEEELSNFSLIQIVEMLDGGETTGIDAKVFREAEYLVIAYGLNDYFKGIKLSSDKDVDIHTYEGALTYAVEYFKEHYPDLQIVLIGQTYCQFYSYGIVEEDSNTRDFGGGVGMDYVNAVKRVADEYGLLFINPYNTLPINEWNGNLYLEDATHLNEKGRMEYAKAVSECILDDYEERNAQ